MILLYSASQLLNSVFYDDIDGGTWHLRSDVRHVMHPLFHKRPKKELTVLFNIHGDHLEALSYDFSEAIDIIKKRYSHCNIVKILPRDVPSYAEIEAETRLLDVPSYTEKENEIELLEAQFDYRLLPEYRFYQEIQHALPAAAVQMFHPQPGLFPIDLSVKYVDPYLFDFYNNFKSLSYRRTLGKIELPKKNLLFTHKLSSLTNAGRIHRCMITTLLLRTNCVLTHLDTLKTIKPKKFQDPDIKKIYIDNAHDAFTKFKQDEFNNRIGDIRPLKESLTLIQKGFCNIVAEDPFYSDKPRITEKTIKPLLCYRPFLLLAPTGTLQWLKDSGFETFSKWWDESYDKQTDHQLRIEAVFKIAQQIDSLSTEQCQAMIHDMRKVLTRNAERAKAFRYDIFRNYNDPTYFKLFTNVNKPRWNLPS